MEKSRFTDHFTLFPYRKEVRDNGDINNGGIDLIKDPCSGQQKLATVLEFFQNSCSDSFGVSPPLY